MTTYETIIQLCKDKGIAPTALEKELGFGRGSIGKLKTGDTSSNRLQKIADYFGVSLDYLITGKNGVKENQNFISPKDERDISKDVERIMQKLIGGEDGPASYDGEILSDESAELFKEELEIALRRLKLINKEKYNPNKNKE